MTGFRLFHLGLMFLALCLVDNSIGWTQEIANRYRPMVGEEHPDFALPSIQDGSKIKLSDHRGKKVVLIHFASW